MLDCASPIVRVESGVVISVRVNYVLNCPSIVTGIEKSLNYPRHQTLKTYLLFVTINSPLWYLVTAFIQHCISSVISFEVMNKSAQLHCCALAYSPRALGMF